MAKATHDEKERVLATRTTYGCAGDLPYLDKRQAQFAQQRLERGFDDTELWSLKTTIAAFCLPRFKLLRQTWPFEQEKEVIDAMDKIIVAFEIMSRDSIVFNKEECVLVEEGLESFKKYYHAFWF